MKLYPPLKQTSSGTPRDLGSLLALESQGFGERPEYYAKYGIKGHNGLDWPLHEGTPIYASHAGIAYTGEDSNKGLGVVVIGEGMKTIYWHLRSFAVSNGREVQVGSILGFGDNTGDSSGSHLHFGLKLLDSNGNVLDRDNGYDGAIDPTPYLVWYDQRTMTKEEVELWYQILDINDPDGSGRAYWVGKPSMAFAKEFAKNKAEALEALIK